MIDMWIDILSSLVVQRSRPMTVVLVNGYGSGRLSNKQMRLLKSRLSCFPMMSFHDNSTLTWRKKAN